VHNKQKLVNCAKEGKGANMKHGVFMKQLITQETLNPKTKLKGIINHPGWIDNT